MRVLDDQYIFFVNQPVKQTRVGIHIKPLRFVKYPFDLRLCIFVHLTDYIRRTSSRQTSNQLLIRFQKPHAPISTDTIVRWVKSILFSAGNDTFQFQAHSTRATGTSFAAKHNVDVSDILSAVGWSKEKTIHKFYNKPLNQDEFNLGNILLTASDIASSS